MFLNTFHLFNSQRKYTENELKLDKPRYLSGAILLTDIRQHSSAAYVGMVGSLYTVIQWKSHTSTLHTEELANETIDEKV